MKIYMLGEKILLDGVEWEIVGIHGKDGERFYFLLNEGTTFLCPEECLPTLLE